MQHRKLDSVYYYMRSLATSTPFISARESLVVIFEEVRKRVAERKHVEQDSSRMKRRAKQENRWRRVTWIHTDGSGGGSGPDQEVGSDLEKLSAIEVNETFSSVNFITFILFGRKHFVMHFVVRHVIIYYKHLCQVYSKYFSSVRQEQKHGKDK